MQDMGWVRQAMGLQKDQRQKAMAFQKDDRQSRGSHERRVVRLCNVSKITRCEKF